MRTRKSRPTEEKTSPKTVLVTGSTRGIGRAVALALAQSGYDVVINARKPTPAALSLLETLEGFGTHPRALFFDVADRKAAQSALAEDVERFGAYWGVVLNATGRSSA